AESIAGESGSESTHGFSGGFDSIVKEDIENMNNLILSGLNANELAETCRKNIQSLEEALRRLDEAKCMLWSGMELRDGIKTALSRDEAVKLLKRGAGSYCNNVAYAIPEILESVCAKMVNDPRKGVKEKVKNSLRLAKGEDIDIRKEGIALEELPSRRKKAGGAGVPYGVNLSEIENDIDFANSNEKFTGKAWEFLKIAGESISAGLEKLRDEIYIGEYIMEKFKSSVPELKIDDAGKAAALRAKNAEMSRGGTFFNSEVEYILHGNPSEKANRIMTEAQVLLVRFGLNTLHAYMDPDKRRFAGSIASAIAGWWTGGAGIPIVSNLILCGWGMAEAVLDLKDLLAGESVPFYKSKDDWKLDIGLSKGIGKTGSGLSFSYHDYLRLFLIMENRDKKLDRVEDLIELNLRKIRSDFRINAYNSCMKVEATLSMKYFFAAWNFTPFNIKAEAGRHKFKIALHRGY
ncbi:MAG: DUF5702 domain-containing protein, partial [Oscillospiraceae bacterium]|nr:DUF5702 domain-containing protein [Oscillospiraceae bacterium]